MHRMRGWLVGIVVGLGLLGCGGDGVPTLTYDEWAERSATAQCSHARTCAGSTLEQEPCVAQVLDSYQQVEPTLEGAEGARSGCVQCMRIRTEELTTSLDSGCQRPPDTARIDAVCGAERQACLGAPSLTP
ncbi:hypothetical protein MFU01_81310 [Myxococcus fulvus]|uniref:Lipoprotein n=2 Tax=Myxococcus fulvus TaxID=33 RepID=A0A511TG02_MYXFU|nr:hypothetical protein MFU01_81310 [Myxococcus fulvus]